MFYQNRERVVNFRLMHQGQDGERGRETREREKEGGGAAQREGD